MSNSSATVGDQKKHGDAAVSSAATSVSSFSIDGLLGLGKQREATKKVETEPAEPSPRSRDLTAAVDHATLMTSSLTPSAAAAAHLIYSAAAASTMQMVPSTAFHSALWSSHHAAALAACRRKCTVLVVVSTLEIICGQY